MSTLENGNCTIAHSCKQNKRVLWMNTGCIRLSIFPDITSSNSEFIKTCSSVYATKFPLMYSVPQLAVKFKNRVWLPQTDSKSEQNIVSGVSDAETSSQVDENSAGIRLANEVQSNTCPEKLAINLCNNDLNSDVETEKENESPKEEFKITTRLAICMVVLMTCLMLSALDYTGTGNIMATIAFDLKGSTSETEWIGNGYSLSACVSQLPIAALSDHFGRRNMLMITLGLFLVGSIICGTAQNMDAFIAGRVIQGIGAGGNLVLPEVIVADIVPLRLRGFYYGICQLIWFGATGIAPMIAGAFAEYSTWRWFYYMNLIIGGPLILMTPLAVRLVPLEGTFWERAKKLDVIGFFLSVTSVTSILIGLGRGDSSKELTWNSWSVVVPLVLGFVGLAVTFVYGFFTKVEVPMFDVRVYGNWSAIICYLHNILQGIVNMATVYFLPTFFQGCKGLNELASGAAILPISLVGPPFGLFFGWAIAKTGHYQLSNIVFWGIAFAGLGVLIDVSEHKSIVALIFMQFLTSIGINTLYTTLSITANATNPPHLWIASTAMMSFCRSLGDAFGTAIGGAIFASEMKQRLKKLSDTGLQIPGEVSVMTIVNEIRSIQVPEIKSALISAVTGTIQQLFVVMTIFCAVGFATSFMQKEYTLDVEMETKQAIDETHSAHISSDSESRFRA